MLLEKGLDRLISFIYLINFFFSDTYRFAYQGTYATVHLAEYTDGTSPKKMRLACKIFDKEKAPPDCLEKFFPRELEILTKIENPHIIQVINFSRIHGLKTKHSQLNVRFGANLEEK